nr:cobalamin-dependent protein [Rhabdothermincola salaria]
MLGVARRGQPRPAIELVLALRSRGLETDAIITDVLAPVQVEVGDRWAANLWSTADEHASTAVVDGVLGALALQERAPDAWRGTALVACAEGEHHTTPARMGAQLLRSEGWDVTFLGGSLPADDLQRYAAVTEPDVVVISCTVPLFLGGARRCFAAVAELGLPALAAGAAFGSDDVRARRLGASGWIGPTADLGAALAAPPARERSPAPSPPEAFALELATEELQRSCLSAMAERLPAMATYSPAQLASTRTDVGYILSYLVTSIDLGDDGIFTAFVEWLAHVLATRGVPPVVLDRSLDIIGDVVAEAGMTEAARLCATQRAAGTPR